MDGTSSERVAEGPAGKVWLANPLSRAEKRPVLSAGSVISSSMNVTPDAAAASTLEAATRPRVVVLSPAADNDLVFETQPALRRAESMLSLPFRNRSMVTIK